LTYFFARSSIDIRAYSNLAKPPVWTICKKLRNGPGRVAACPISG
jgi:hypothetical protein